MQLSGRQTYLQGGNLLSAPPLLPPLGNVPMSLHPSRCLAAASVAKHHDNVLSCLAPAGPHVGCQIWPTVALALLDWHAQGGGRSARGLVHQMLLFHLCVGTLGVLEIAVQPMIFRHSCRARMRTKSPPQPVAAQAPALALCCADQQDVYPETLERHPNEIAQSLDGTDVNDVCRLASQGSCLHPLWEPLWELRTKSS